LSFLAVKKSATFQEAISPQPVEKKPSVGVSGSKSCTIEQFRLVSVLGRGHFGKVRP
jgi:hypothetical protein